ncbi:MAG: DNA recombination protein RmuC [Candidatus Thermoplasmatota archaeon]|jgi:DNA recombination protein RmuC|nr:DNA recombination protein RmuC [Candidatus Thermoplasmatota archaeon]MCL5987712.1 DNA recombination protein RmuC [Candidatus Thermoplasmatota archaeon]
MLSYLYFILGFLSGSAMVTVVYLLLIRKGNIAGERKSVIKEIAKEVMNEANSNSAGVSELMAKVVASNTETVMERKSEEIGSIIRPLREMIDEYSTRIRQFETSRVQEYGGLKEAISNLQDMSSRVSDEARFLSDILKNPQERGKWGEMSMRRVVEIAGMVEHIDFKEQFVLDSGDRPDMVINLPGERKIILDSKAPLNRYLEYAQASSESHRKILLEQFASDLKGHIRALSGRGYNSKMENSADFVIMFLPAESMLSSALSTDSEILEFSLRNNIILASPVMLVSLLRIINMGWREKKSMENVAEILKSAEILNERIVAILQRMESMGRSIDSTVRSYNDIIGMIRNRVIPSIRNMEELGGMKGPDRIPEPIENYSRKGELMEWIDSNPKDQE